MVGLGVRLGSSFCCVVFFLLLAHAASCVQYSTVHPAYSTVQYTQHIVQYSTLNI